MQGLQAKMFAGNTQSNQRKKRLPIHRIQSGKAGIIIPVGIARKAQR